MKHFEARQIIALLFGATLRKNGDYLGAPNGDTHMEAGDLSRMHEPRNVGAASALLFIVAFSLVTPSARAQSADPDPAGAEAHAKLRAVRRESLAQRQELHLSLVSTGIVSVVSGAAMSISGEYDQAIRVAGINTGLFGLVNTIVGAVALAGIAEERRRWEDDFVARTRADRLRYREHAIADESREAFSHALNLGFAAGYGALGGLSLVVSRTDVAHPNRWLGAGVALLAQATNLAVVDVIGAITARRFERRMRQIAPVVAYDPTTGDAQLQLSLRQAF